MASFAAQPNTVVKISGIGVPGQEWTPALQRAVVLETVGLFGAGRCLVASNFPVDSLCASYDAILSGLKAITAGRPAADQIGRASCRESVWLYGQITELPDTSTKKQKK